MKILRGWMCVAALGMSALALTANDARSATYLVLVAIAVKP